MSGPAQVRAAGIAGHGAPGGGHGPGHGGHGDPAAMREASKLGLWTFLATEVLLFGGLFTAYVVFRLRYHDLFHAGHLSLDRVLGTVNTVVLIASSFTVALGIAAIREGKAARMRLFFLLTILLAAAFLGIKAVEYSAKLGHGITPGTDLFFSLYFMMTGLHGLHVIAGMAVLGWVALAAGKGRFSAAYHTPVELAGLYWHFVDLVWIYLFPMLYLIG